MTRKLTVILLSIGILTAATVWTVAQGGDPVDPSAAVARLLDLSEAEVSVEHAGISGIMGNDYSVDVKDPNTGEVLETGELTFDEKTGTISKLLLSNRLKESGHVVSAGAPPQEKAEDIIQTRSPFDLKRLKLTYTRLVGERIWVFLWEDVDPKTGVSTGGRVGMGISASTGKLVSYHAYMARPNTLADATVTESEARKAVEDLYAGSDYTISEHGTLQLSSPLVNGRPIWIFEISRDDQIIDITIVDARTGKCVRP